MVGKPGVGRRERRIGVVRHAAQPARQRQQALAGFVEHVLLLAKQILDEEAIERQRRRLQSIQARTVSIGMRSSSGLNQDVACRQRAISICTR